MNAAWSFVESTAFALGIFAVTYLFLVQPAAVVGASSYPTIKTGEKVFAEKVSYHLHNPERGDFVILESPRNPEVDFIKRIVGLPGERIMIQDGKVFINGQVLEEKYISSGTFTGPENYLSENQELLIPDGYYFVMGDNREHSSDSRDFGPVSKEKIVGKVAFRFWPTNRLGSVE